MKNEFGINYQGLKSLGHKIIVPIIIFLIAFIPRVDSLGIMATSDEGIWIQLSLTFFNAITHFDWANTYQVQHPGVTTMWLSGTSLGLFYKDGMDSVTKYFIAEFPVALITSIGIVLIYYLLKNIFNIKIAILSALFLAFDPMYLTNSRLIHVDALLSTFMTLSVLSLLTYLNDPDKKYYLIFTGIFCALSILTKLPGIFLLLFIPLIIVLWNLSNTFKVNVTIKTIFLFLATSFMFIFLLWPSMWVNPINTIHNLSDYILYVQKTPFGAGFFMGEISDGNYGWFYYPIVLIVKSSYVTLFFSMVCFVYLAINTKRSSFIKINKNVYVFIIYMVLFTIQMTLGSRYADRYLLPVFLITDILAAIGLVLVVESIMKKTFVLSIIENRYLENINIRKFIHYFLFIPIILLHISLSLPLHPYYGSYYNPILGNSSHATDTLLFGWGEGMDLAARYLNEKPDAINLTVAAQYEGFSQYFKGKSIPLNRKTSNVSSADYIVFYVCTLQRDYNNNIWEQYKNKKPDKIIVINDINFAWIYKKKVEMVNNTFATQN